MLFLMIADFAMVNTPIPHNLRSEAKKAAKILRDFSMPSAKSGLDKIIPAGLLLRAEGLAIITVAKIGFLVTARGGSGIVIAKLKGGEWSAPSAIGIAGLGGGFEIGCEVTDFIIILNKRSAVEAFSKGGNLTLGGNCTIAAGPLGRNVEADVAVRSPAAVYTYSKTKGLFAGISIEGSALIERKDANKKFYCENVRASEILNGEVEQPASCKELYEVLSEHKAMFFKSMEAKAKAEARSYAKDEAKKRGLPTSIPGFKSSKDSTKRRGSYSCGDDYDDKYQSNNYDDNSQVKDYSSYAICQSSDEESNPSPKNQSKYKRTTTTTKTTKTKGPTGTGKMTRSSSMLITKSSHTTSYKSSKKKTTSTDDLCLNKKAPLSTVLPKSDPWVMSEPSPQHPVAVALWSYAAQMPCDLTFFTGDKIEVLTRTPETDDWWEGRINGHTGIFPANYTRLST